MTDVFLDVGEASRALQSVAEGVRASHTQHAALTPHFPPHAAGKAFAGHAARLQAAFMTVHERGALRFAHAESVAQAAVAQFAAVGAADDANAAQLRGVGGAL